VPTPTVEGPIPVTESSHPFLATDIPLASYGYQEDEYFISGTGYTYNTGGAVNVNGSKITTGGPNNNGTYPFKTRIVVRRPSNPANFNGKVIVEWENVTAGYDLEANWFSDPYYLIKQGYAFVGVSAQNVGVSYLKKWNAERYGSLEVGPTGDALSYDIYASAIKAIRGDGTGPEPLGSLTPDITKVTASGESQSCGRLVTYYNKVAPLQEIADDYLLTVCTSAIRADRPEKVLRIISEFENKEQQTEAEAPANPALRHWEAAGGSHVPFMAAANWQVPVERDTGPDIADCAHKPVLSRVQWPYLIDAGTKELNEWQEGGSPPPLAPRGEYESPKKLKRNSLGIALGGIRLPDMDVPTGVNLAENSAAPESSKYPDSAFCILLGQYAPFSEETLDGLYSDYGEYVDKVKADVESLEAQGFVLTEAAQRMVDSAEEFPRLRPTVPALSGSSPNTGSFQLSWRGAVPSHERALVPRFVETDPTFELQARNGEGEWTTVASGLSEQGYSFAHEEPGDWSYRVRSTTVIPAFALEPEETITTPWSEALTGVEVYSQIVTGSRKGTLVVKGGESVLVAPGAETKAITVQEGGQLDVEEASATKVKSSGATGIRICGSTVASLKVLASTGPVVVGDGGGCAGNTDSLEATLSANGDGVTVVGNSVAAKLKVTGNSGGVTVTDNTAKTLTVTGNSGTVVDTPNTVSGRSKLQ
jgi:Alpha/beta hydrolase domain